MRDASGQTFPSFHVTVEGLPSAMWLSAPRPGNEVMGSRSTAGDPISTIDWLQRPVSAATGRDDSSSENGRPRTLLACNRARSPARHEPVSGHFRLSKRLDGRASPPS